MDAILKRLIPLLFLATTASASYSGYTYQRTLTVDHTKTSNGVASYSNMAVLVSTNDVSLSTAVSGGHLSNSSGYDLIFSTMSDCSYLLFWDTETVNNTGSATMNTWVKVPSISSTTDTVFYMCYGNAGTTSYQGTSQSTWDSNYTGVWHLPNGTTLALNDSTSNAVTLTGHNAPTAATGQIDGALAVANASSQWADNSSDLLSAAMTVEAWFKPSSFPNAYNTLIGVDGSGHYFDLHIKSSGKLAIYIQATGGQPFYDGSGATTLSAGTWYHIVATYDSTNGLAAYVNGSSDSTVSAQGTITLPGTIVQLGNDLPNFGGRYVDGVIDEARVSNLARSADWVKTEYNNQNSPSTFYAYGAETTSGGATSAPNRTLMGVGQ